LEGWRVALEEAEAMEAVLAARANDELVAAAAAAEAAAAAAVRGGGDAGADAVGALDRSDDESVHCVVGERSVAAFTKLFVACRQAARTNLSVVKVDPPKPTDSLIAKAESLWRLFEATTWPDSVKHLATTVLVIVGARPIGASRPDLVLLLHVSLGTHDAILRAHNWFCFVWACLERCWLRVEGVMPFHALTRLQRHLHRTEGLMRCFVGDVEQTTAGIVQAIDDALKRRAGESEERLLDHFEQCAFMHVANALAHRRRGGRGRGGAVRARARRGGFRLAAAGAAAADSVGPDAMARAGATEADAVSVGDVELGEIEPGSPWYVFVIRRCQLLGARLEDMLTGTRSPPCTLHGRALRSRKSSASRISTARSCTAGARMALPCDWRSPPSDETSTCACRIDSYR